MRQSNAGSIAAFRLDAINWIGKEVRWSNIPRRFGWHGYTRQQHLYDRDQPLAHQVMRDLRRTDSLYPDMVLIGEASADTPGGPASFYGTDSDELHMVFDFRLLKSPWRADRFRELMTDGDRAVPPGDWPSIVFSYHDQSRHIDRYGVGGDADRRARAAALLLFTMRGTPFLYYGEEIGMRNGQLRYRDLRDPYAKRFWPFRLVEIQPGRPCSGMGRRRLVSRPACRGCRFPRLFPRSMSNRLPVIRRRSFSCTAGSSGCGNRCPPFCTAPMYRANAIIKMSLCF
ncbi:MAG: alpha-amylase family glycosyl hydrolase [Nitrospira sp.]|nr:alpha-amylase family glycosyl hydrolase [Nitrospira sp.]MDH4303422.1 alpha-amylase family glycosyl hydrolase [Nitrospira sp.]MDH5192099.1 alpha-amylase family glycosyl hydrolase [Nitrospira sp.]